MFLLHSCWAFGGQMMAAGIRARYSRVKRAALQGSTKLRIMRFSLDACTSVQEICTVNLRTLVFAMAWQAMEQKAYLSLTC